VIIAQRLYRMNLNLFDEIYLQNNADIRTRFERSDPVFTPAW